MNIKIVYNRKSRRLEEAGNGSNDQTNSIDVPRASDPILADAALQPQVISHIEEVKSPRESSYVDNANKKDGFLPPINIARN